MFLFFYIMENKTVNKLNKTVVVKVGSNVVITDHQKVDSFRLSELAFQVAALINEGHSVVLVISGAVAAGKGLTRELIQSNDHINKQVLAGLGQSYLTAEIFNAFKTKGIKTMQLLVTKDGLTKENDLKGVLKESIKNNFVPILNENDVISLNSFGGNDHLALEVAKIVDASFLVLLTNVDCLYCADFENKIFAPIYEVKNIDGKILNLAFDKKSKDGVGGMRDKLQVVKDALTSGITTVLANGKAKDILIRLILQNERAGTRFCVS